MDSDYQSELSLCLLQLFTAVTVILNTRSFDHDMLRCQGRLNRGRLSSLTCLSSKIFVLWLFVVHFEH